MATGRQAAWLRVGGIPEEELCVGTAPPPTPTPQDSGRLV